ncbi:MAG: NUDIX domain-containing protein [Planctomycetota bacterium]|nr:NUDIX domain-containing protein [Planctomycetota bacterium]
MIPQFICSIPFRIEDGEARYVVMERTPDENVGPGFWQFVTGTHPNEEWSPITALREVEEECGLRPVRLYAVDHIHRIWLAKQDRIIHGPVFAAELPQGQVVLSEEHSAYKWESCEEAMKTLRRRSQRQSLAAFHEDIVEGDRWDEFRLWDAQDGWLFYAPPSDTIDRRI